ncbi:polyphosphate kinase 2 family protein [Microvirga sp. 2MCAF38]|uniref:polyphosphate kinase 2 family protein n=1 Tax=Microvirga sp. 2MCAF38 TaxID=3232989 RepID=UPI003F9A9C4E
MSDMQALIKKFRVKPGDRVKLRDQDAREESIYPDKDVAKAATEVFAKDINKLQDRLYAENKRALLVVLQGTDTAGKDGTITSVFSETSPLGVAVTAFRQPSEEELSHDFLWRVHMVAPRRGMVGIFNRSQYEDVLVAKVHRLAPKDVIEQRYDQINAFEKMLTENGTVILKFMLHVSKDEQKVRLQERVDDPAKRWKFNPGDLKDREHWDEFQDAYETMLHRCSTPWAPWHVIPADKKWVRDAIVASIVKTTLEEMNPSYPEVTWKKSEIKIS